MITSNIIMTTDQWARTCKISVVKNLCGSIIYSSLGGRSLLRHKQCFFIYQVL